MNHGTLRSPGERHGEPGGEDFGGRRNDGRDCESRGVHVEGFGEMHVTPAYGELVSAAVEVGSVIGRFGDVGDG